MDRTNHHNTNNNIGVEYASFDSTRTDLSMNSRDVIIGDQWVVLGRIGEGSFGEVFEAEDIDTTRKYAIKREPLKMRHPQLKHESIIYDVLAGGPGIPQCHWHGQHEGFDCIVIDLLGPNLNQLREVVHKFPIDVVIDFGCQMVSILEHIHKRGLVYRDIKPDNFLFSYHCHLPEADMIEIPDDHGMPHIKYVNLSCEEVFKRWNEPHPKLYIVDFGLTTWWKDPHTDKPYPEVKKNIKNKTGTARYASLNVHRGKSHARRDDIEGMGYLLLDLIFGTLPWTGIQARNSRAGWDRMRQIKQDTFMSDLCAGLPQGFLEFIEYARRIKFAETPDYDLLRQFLQGSLPGGKYASIVKSPFGGHTERKWVQDIEKEDPTEQTRNDAARPNTIKPSTHRHYYEPPRQKEEANVFSMEDVAHHLPDIKKTPRRTSRDIGRTNNDSFSSFQKLVAKTRRRQKRVGWNSHKHDEAPWAPVIDWTNTAPEKPSAQAAEASWGADNPNAAWGQHAENREAKKEEEGSWAANVSKPWE
ncbi:kinase-like domain-containing protein [Gilbertella persicaria]|uniref:kinase-like domain-containing protein n=1 Tax=Gilbertella persicaria TaxID=101096 RepID=UPI00221E75C2|nr:kinase-like domain-containing protein [Gilbertella persicaria]KAI8090233.1 kinase-like domain-containing protein [Gilbertella persicaria]